MTIFFSAFILYKKWDAKQNDITNEEEIVEQEEKNKVEQEEDGMVVV
jgi:hypothetical protein